MNEGASAFATPIGQRRSRKAFWLDAVAPYAQPHLGRGVLDIATSVVPYLALSVLM